ncbi:hypothetical protein Cgig2_024074 [Carnegiea gigantea]|uniref:Uncharacterized protein n=1 Tax=Carnegiea gigantea TaxID=171969 RepID=A0A9Q1K7F6_9CARY|nr:hypothetical protein Cgig2_024074 [Carnegiea gigantea]
MIDNYGRRHVIEIDLNEEIEEFNDNVEKRIDLNEEAEGMNEEVEKEQINMGEELNEDSDGSNNTDKVPDPCVGMCFDSREIIWKEEVRRRTSILHAKKVEQIIQSIFSSVEARRGGASGAYDDTLLEMGNREDGNSQDLSLNSGINWFNSQP